MNVGKDCAQFVAELLNVGGCEDLNQSICNDQSYLKLLRKELWSLFLAFN
jgi:hypothetical protein